MGPRRRSFRTRASLRRAALVGLALLLVYGARWLEVTDSGSVVPAPPEAARPAPGAPDDAARIAELFARRRSGVVVEAAGRVERVLRDDLEGSRHQRLVLRLEGGQTLLLAHNIDLAPRVPAEPGDRLRFRGQYEWNERGGVVHWTHHDPDGRRPGGWLEHRGRRYR